MTETDIQIVKVCPVCKGRIAWSYDEEAGYGEVWCMDHPDHFWRPIDWPLDDNNN